jgi:hypothetical protein
MIASTIYNQLKTTLENNSNLSEYIEHIFDGKRFYIEPDSMPCILLQPVSDNVVEQEYNNVKKVWMTLDVIVITEAQEHPEYCIVGEKGKGYYGILDITNDIRACLESSNTLGDYVIDTKIETIEFDVMTIDNFATQSARLPVKILYQQVEGV